MDIETKEFLGIFKNDLGDTKARLSSFLRQMPRQIVYDEMERKFKEFIQRAREIFEETAESALAKIMSSEHFREIEEWYHSAFKRVSNFEKQLEQEKVSICEIYRFVKSDLSGITQQMDSFSEQVDTLQHFEIKFSIDELRNNIRTQIPRASKKNESLVTRLSTYTSTWAVGPDKIDAISFLPLGGDVLFTGFGAFGFSDVNLKINYKVAVDERIVQERRGVNLGFTDSKTPNRVELQDAVRVREGQAVDVLVEYEKRDSIPYGKNGGSNAVLNEKINISFRKSNLSNNGTDGKSGQIPFICVVPQP